MKIVRNLLLIIYALTQCNTASCAQDWQTSSGGVSATRYSDLSEIDKGNVHELERAWTYRLPKFSSVDYSVQENTVETTPITTPKYVISVDLASHLYALDPMTGRVVWRTKLSTPVGRRGIAYAEGYVYVGTSDGTRQIDEENGRVRRKFGNSLSFIAPVIVKNTIFVANYVDGLAAYKINDGQLIWARPLSSECGIGRVWSGFSFDPETDSLFVVTGNSGALTEQDPPNCYSNSVVAIAADDGKIKWKFQEFERDMWDLDMVGNPITATLSSNGRRARVVLALSKTGNVYILDSESGKLLNGSETHQPSGKVKSAVSGMRVGGLLFAESNIKKTDVLNQAYISRKLKHFKEFDFTSASPGQPAFFYGLHGGFEWPGGSIHKPTNILVAASNSYPWIIRVEHQYQDPEGLAQLITRSNHLVEHCVICHNNDLLGRMGSELDKFGGGAYIPPLLKPLGFATLLSQNIDEFKNTHKFARHEVKPLLSPELAYQAADDTVWRVLKKMDRVMNVDWLHSLLITIFQTVGPAIVDIDLIIARFAQIDADQLKASQEEITRVAAQLDPTKWTVAGHWQMLTDLYDKPVSSPPWGYLSAIDLSTKNLLWQVPFGYEVDGHGNKIPGSRNMGGVLTTKSGLIFASGAVDKMARAYDIENGSELWSATLKAAGSAPPMTYAYNGCQYVIFTATGGRFSFFGPNGRDIELVAYKLPSCRS